MSTLIQNILINERTHFLNFQHLNSHELKTYNYLANCGTAKFGFNSYLCNDCGHKIIHYNSCGNRHCPSCQAKSREEWISQIQSFLLDIPYFHIVFTVPDTLNDIFFYNKKAMYDLLFKSSSKTLLQAGKQKYGQLGFTSILHTWGSQLWFHPHIHMIVSGGGISKDDNGKDVFNKAKNDFLLSVKVLSKLFRGKFIASLKKLKLKDKNDNFINFNDDPYKSLIDELYRKDWVVYSKKPFGSNKAVLNYIGRYSHRVAITNSRIINYDKNNHKVTFKYKDYKCSGKQKEMTLHSTEFIRRFMLHVLPPRFIKIRHYGFMSNSNRKTLLPQCRILLEMPSVISKSCVEPKPLNHICPKCSGPLTLILARRVNKPDFHNNSS